MKIEQLEAEAKALWKLVEQASAERDRARDRWHDAKIRLDKAKLREEVLKEIEREANPA